MDSGNSIESPLIAPPQLTRSLGLAGPNVAPTSIEIPAAKADDNKLSLDLIGEAIHSALYSGVQEPLTGIEQLIDHVSHTIGGGSLPEIHIIDAPSTPGFGTARWAAQNIGSGIGMAADFLAVDLVLGKTAQAFANRAESFGLLNREGMATWANLLQLIGKEKQTSELLLAGRSIAQAALSGAAYGFLFTPSDPRGDFLSQRLNSSITSGLTFGVQRAVTLGLNNLSSAKLGFNPEDAYFQRTGKGFLARFGANVVGGVAGGTVNAESSSLLSGRGLASGDAVAKSAFTFAFTGGALDIAHFTGAQLPGFADRFNNAIGRGVPLDRQLRLVAEDHTGGTVDPNRLKEVGNILGADSGTRVVRGKTPSFDPETNKITLPKGAGLEVLAEEATHASGRSSEASESLLKLAKAALPPLDPDGPCESLAKAQVSADVPPDYQSAWYFFEGARRDEERSARLEANRIVRTIDPSAPEKPLDAVDREIASARINGRTYEQIWLDQFRDFVKNGGSDKRFVEYHGTAQGTTGDSIAKALQETHNNWLLLTPKMRELVIQNFEMVPPDLRLELWSAAARFDRTSPPGKLLSNQAWDLLQSFTPEDRATAAKEMARYVSPAMFEYGLGKVLGMLPVEERTELWTEMVKIEKMLANRSSGTRKGRSNDAAGYRNSLANTVGLLPPDSQMAAMELVYDNKYPGSLAWKSFSPQDLLSMTKAVLSMPTDSPSRPKMLDELNISVFDRLSEHDRRPVQLQFLETVFDDLRVRPEDLKHLGHTWYGDPSLIDDVTRRLPQLSNDFPNQATIEATLADVSAEKRLPELRTIVERARDAHLPFAASLLEPSELLSYFKPDQRASAWLELARLDSAAAKDPRCLFSPNLLSAINDIPANLQPEAIGEVFARAPEQAPFIVDHLQLIPEAVTALMLRCPTSIWHVLESLNLEQCTAKPGIEPSSNAKQFVADLISALSEAYRSEDTKNTIWRSFSPQAALDVQPLLNLNALTALLNSRESEKLVETGAVQRQSVEAAALALRSIMISGRLYPDCEKQLSAALVDLDKQISKGSLDTTDPNGLRLAYLRCLADCFVEEGVRSNGDLQSCQAAASVAAKLSKFDLEGFDAFYAPLSRALSSADSTYEWRLALAKNLAKLQRENEFGKDRHVELPNLRMQPKSMPKEDQVRLRNALDGALHAQDYEGLRQLLDDDVLRMLFPTIFGPAEKGGMVGRVQHGAHHYTLDNHTLELIRNIDTIAEGYAEKSKHDPHYPQLTDEELDDIRLAALLHDIGKDPGVVDPEHEWASANLAWGVLRTLGYSPIRSQRIVSLISRHSELSYLPPSDTQPLISTELSENQKHLDDLAVFFRNPAAPLQVRILNEADIRAVQKNDAWWKSEVEKELDRNYELLSKRVAELNENALPFLPSWLGTKNFVVLRGDWFVLAHSSPYLNNDNRNGHNYFLEQLPTMESPNSALSVQGIISGYKRRFEGQHHVRQKLLAMFTAPASSIAQAYRHDLRSGFETGRANFVDLASNWPQEPAHRRFMNDLRTRIKDAGVPSLTDMNRNVSRIEYNNDLPEPYARAHAAIVDALMTDDRIPPPMDLPKVNELKIKDPIFGGIIIDASGGEDIYFDGATPEDLKALFEGDEPPSYCKLGKPQHKTDVVVPKSVWQKVLNQEGLQFAVIDPDS
jgi:hypothetical protein